MSKVFISYSQDPAESQLVLALADMLRGHGIDAIIDRFAADGDGDWVKWCSDQIANAKYVICVCTPSYHAKFERLAGDAGRGVAFEATHIRHAVYQQFGRASKFLVVAFSEANLLSIPDVLKGASRFLLTTEVKFEQLKDHLLGRGAIAARPLEDDAETPTRTFLRLEFGPGDSVVAIEQEARQSPIQLDPEVLAKRIVANDCAVIRLTFDYVGDAHYRVAIQCRDEHESSFDNDDTLAVRISDTLDIGWEGIVNYPMLVPILAQGLNQARPVRIQLRFAGSAKSLDRLVWESAPLNGRPLHTHALFVLTRSFVLIDGDVPEIRVSPKAETDFHLVHVTGLPRKVLAHYVWNAFAQIPKNPGSLIVRQFSTPLTYNQFGGPGFDDQLSRTDVLFFPLVVALSNDTSGVSYFVLPDARGSLQYVTAYEFIARLRELPKRPIVFILGPSDWSPATQKRLFDFSNGVVTELAHAGVGSIVSLSSPALQSDWMDFVGICAKELQLHGIVDAAVALALRQVGSLAGKVRLHLRNKSARLWYRAGLVSVGATDNQDWNAFRKALQARPGQLCAVVGPGVDPELKLSRRIVAREMALTNGFSLSHKDERSLARVAEYIRVRGAPPVSVESGPAHVAAFLKHVREYLVNEILPGGPNAGWESRSIQELVSTAGKKQLQVASSPYRLLGQLQASCYVTTNFHSLIDESITLADREPTVFGFRDRPEGSVPDVDLQHPMVYHAFGAFSDPRNLALAESDHLDFFSEFVNADPNPVLKRVQALILSSALLFVGFHPESWEFRVLFAALTRMRGARLALQNVHIAVQVDPEDDQIIDPDGAKHFYEGLLAPLGTKVFVYWGRPEQFLLELKDHVPEAFPRAVSKQDALREEATP